MKPDISEFSYGYAITDELIHWRGTAITASPIFPSLYQEGQAGGGYDVMLSRPGLPLFLQFKLSDYMVRKNAHEAQLCKISVPYYRMKLRSKRYSQQHEMLLELENLGQEVYYSAPAFHKQTELNKYYFSHQIRDKSIWIRPSFVGPLPDNNDHSLSFRLSGPIMFCSEPREIQCKGTFEEFSFSVKSAFREKCEQAIGQDALKKLSSLIVDILKKHTDIFHGNRKSFLGEIQSKSQIEQIALYSNYFLNCHFFIVHQQEDSG